MESRPEPGRKPSEKKTPGMGNNVIWYLLALGIGTVFLVALLASQPDVEIRFGELDRLISMGSDAKNEREGKPPANIVVHDDSSEAKGSRRFSHLSDLTVGVSEITGKVTMRQLDTHGNPTGEEQNGVRFSTPRMGLDHDLFEPLKANGFSDVRAERAPSGLRAMPRS